MQNPIPNFGQSCIISRLFVWKIEIFDELQRLENLIFLTENLYTLTT